MSTTTDSDTTDDTGTRLPAIVDWGIALALFLAGVLSLLFGVLVYGFADRPAIQDLVADGTIRSDLLTPDELVDVTYNLAWWGGLGFLLIGAILLVAAIAFAWYRRRARHRGDADRAPPATWPNAGIGAVVTIVTTAIPLSPIIGGVVAGSLEGGDRRARTRVGAYAGVIAAIPIVVLFVFLVGGFLVVTTELGLTTAAVAGIVGLLIGLAVAVLYVVGLSAFGGYLSLIFADERSL